MEKIQYKLYRLSKMLEAGDVAFDELKITGSTNLGNVKNDLKSYSVYERYGLRLESGGKEYKAIPIEGVLYNNQIVSLALNKLKNIDKEVFNKLGQLFINNIFLDACFKVLKIPIDHNQNFENAKKLVLLNEGEDAINANTKLKNKFTVSQKAIDELKKCTINILSLVERRNVDQLAEEIKKIIIKENEDKTKNIVIKIKENVFDVLLEKIDKYIQQDYSKNGVEDFILKEGIKFLNEEFGLDLNDTSEYYLNIEDGEDNFINFILNLKK